MLTPSISTLTSGHIGRSHQKFRAVLGTRAGPSYACFLILQGEIYPVPSMRKMRLESEGEGIISFSFLDPPPNSCNSVVFVWGGGALSLQSAEAERCFVYCPVREQLVSTLWMTHDSSQ